MHDSPATPHQQNTLLDFFEDGLDFDSPADVPTAGGTIGADVPGRENGHVATSSNKQVRPSFGHNQSTSGRTGGEADSESGDDSDSDSTDSHDAALPDQATRPGLAWDFHAESAPDDKRKIDKLEKRLTAATARLKEARDHVLLLTRKHMEGEAKARDIQSKLDSGTPSLL